MSRTKEDLLKQISTLEDELQRVISEKEHEFRYTWSQGKARFEKEVLRQHAALRVGLFPYVLHSRTLVVLTSPLIYLMVIPFGLLDLFITTYQAACFPVYGVPKVARADYILFDRGHLAYLNVLERFNCFYCSYANGLIAYVREIAARTEQHWCPIKHAQRLRAPHSRYPHFLDYGDAATYSRQIETVRRDFADVNSSAAARVPPAPPAS